MSTFARFQRFTIGLSACFSIASCVTPLPDNAPPLMESRARDIVAVLEVISVRFYERKGGLGYSMVDDDGQEYVLYASDPPFRVRARLVSQLYGPALGREITFKTHSHWGTGPLTNGNLKLVHLVTDGTIVVMPDEQQADAGLDRKGMLVTPVHPNEISWLPCGTNALKVPLSARSSTRFRAYSGSEPSEEDKAYFWFEGSRKDKDLLQIYPRYAIPIDQLAMFLQAKQPKGEDFWCLQE